MFRHRKNHLPELLARALAAKPRPVSRAGRKDPADPAYDREIAGHHEAVEKRQEHHAIDVMQQLRAINAACPEVLSKARAAEKHSTLLGAVDRIHRQIELQARLLGELQDGQTVNVLTPPSGTRCGWWWSTPCAPTPTPAPRWRRPSSPSPPPGEVVAVAADLAAALAADLACALDPVELAQRVGDVSLMVYKDAPRARPAAGLPAVGGVVRWPRVSRARAGAKNAPLSSFTLGGR